MLSNAKSLVRKALEPLKQVILKGAVLDAWMRRKARLLDKQYTEKMVGASLKKSHGPHTPTNFAKKSLQNILVMADNQWEDIFLIPELKKICKVEYLNFRPSLASELTSWTPVSLVLRATEEFIHAQPRYTPDAILLYASATLLSDALFDLLRKTWNCPIIGMNLDDRIAFFDYPFFRETRVGGYQRWAPKFDLNLTNNLVAVDWYREVGADAYYFPQGFFLDPKIGPPQPHLPYPYTLSFVGSRRSDRAQFIDTLRSIGIPVKVFGTGWKDGIWENDLTAIYRKSQINLGIGSVYPFSVLANLKGRDFECPSTGACYMTTYHWELGLHYEIGKEILCYRCIEELAELYSFYRPRPEACYRIALAAYQHAIREHTWEQRFRKLFDFMGFRYFPDG